MLPERIEEKKTAPRKFVFLNKFPDYFQFSSVFSKVQF